jgi:hypothetical protein
MSSVGNPFEPGLVADCRRSGGNCTGAAALGLQMQVVEVKTRADFDRAFAAILRAATESILLPPEPLIL